MKKQIVKMNRGKRIISAGLLGLMLMGSLSTTALAGNIQDLEYRHYSGVNGFATATRAKTDYTSAYIHHQGERSADVQVCSMGINYSANGSSYYIEPGKAAYLPNYVKENGKSNCYLYLTPSEGVSCSLYGVWSPDSV